jgi:hypothetical protein
MWKGDIGAMAVAYVVLVGLVVYLIQQQARTNPIFRSAIGKLVENCSGMDNAVPVAPPASLESD